MPDTLRALLDSRVLSPARLARLLMAFASTGRNPYALLSVAAATFPERVAITDERGSLTYESLLRQVETLAVALRDRYAVTRGTRVALMCRNHAAAVKALFALARAGADVVLINPETRGELATALCKRMRFDFAVHDDDVTDVFPELRAEGRSIPAYGTSTSIDVLANATVLPRLRLGRGAAGSIVVLTSGTTGQLKCARRRPRVSAFLPPFLALLTRLHLGRYDSVYVATPMCHGFGLAAVFIAVALGAHLLLTDRFTVTGARALLTAHRVDVIALVPVMLRRLLADGGTALAPVRCVISGGAALDPDLALEYMGRFGPTLHNLYGTSEAGFCILATADQILANPASIGRPVPGVKVRITDDQGRPRGPRQVGALSVRSAWTTSARSWIDTGDLAWFDEEGRIYLNGRVDDMVVSGGENVYPIELERVLLQHADVVDAIAFGVPDREYGQRLDVAVVPREGRALDVEALREWLRDRIARHQMPRSILVYSALPFTPLGEPDRELLRRTAIESCASPSADPRSI